VNINVSPIFENAAKMAGNDGGNPDGRLWFCGIEPGSPDDIPDNSNPVSALNNYITKGFSYERDNIFIPCWNDKFKDFFRDKYTKWQFEQKVAKIACSYHDRPISEYKQYLEEELYAKDGNTFKLNLYPFAFKSSDDYHWTKKYYKATGIPNKTYYRAWCMEHRFPVLRNLLIKYEPATLICAGSSFKYDFMLAFAPDKLFEEIEIEEINNKYIIEYFLLGKSLVIITPFLGLGGLMSDDELEALGKFARKQNLP
jgi:hypothetical protein